MPSESEAEVTGSTGSTTTQPSSSTTAAGGSATSSLGVSEAPEQQNFDFGGTANAASGENDGTFLLQVTTKEAQQQPFIVLVEYLSCIQYLELLYVPYEDTTKLS